MQKLYNKNQKICHQENSLKQSPEKKNSTSKGQRVYGLTLISYWKKDGRESKQGRLEQQVVACQVLRMEYLLSYWIVKIIKQGFIKHKDFFTGIHPWIKFHQFFKLINIYIDICIYDLILHSHCSKSDKILDGRW
jgi:hypothetical protein